MSISTYAELQTAVANWLNRGDLTTVIPDLIRLAESNFNRKLRTRDMLTRSTATISQQFTSLPSDFRELENIQINTSRPYPLHFRSPGDLDKDRQEMYPVAGEPRAYTILGSNLEVAPTPDTSYTAEIAYYAAIPALSSTQTTNWLLTKYPDLYLYGALMHSAPFLRDDERVPLWRALHGEILDGITIEDERAKHSGSKLNSRIKAI